MKIKTISSILFIFLTLFQICNATRDCYTPSYIKGECVNMEDCDFISKLQKNPQKTRSDNVYFRDSVCSIVNKQIKVCCETEKEMGNCTTPDKKKGNCISLFDCPSLLNLSRNYVNLDNNEKNKLNASYCDEHSIYSVCCNDFMKSSTKNNLLPPRTECGRHINQQRLQDIIDGETGANQYPWMALIEFKNQRNVSSYRGYGILINSRYILTNANMLEVKSLTLTNVVLGKYDISSLINCKFDCDNSDRIAIEKKIPHPMFSSFTLENDIGLIRMVKSVAYTDSIRPICLPQINIAEEPKYPPIELIVSGWYLVIGAPVETKNKLHMKIPLVDNRICENKFNNRFSSNYLCVGEGNDKSTCMGDSSAPLMRPKNDQLELIGIFSSGPTKCTGTGIPDSYVNIFLYIDWIIEHLEM